MEKITIRIKGKKQTLETEGFAGAACLRETADYRHRLGGVVLREEPTAEALLPETDDEVSHES